MLNRTIKGQSRFEPYKCRHSHQINRVSYHNIEIAAQKQVKIER